MEKNMSKKILSILFLFFLIGIFSCSNNTNVKPNKEIILIVENRLSLPLTSSLKQYKLDLENEGYRVKVEKSVNSSTPPSEIRRILQQDYNDNLTGAVLIGNISAPFYNEKKNQGDPYWHNYLNDFYYMDLDGTWEDTDNDGVLDLHKDTKIDFWNKLRRIFNLGNNCTPEIWVSRIRADKLISLGDEVTLVKNYFIKNHDYRTGNMKLPPKRAFVVSAGIDVLRSDWGARPNEIYSDLESVQFKNNLADTLRKFLSSEYGYELGIINVFSGPRIHHFNYFNTGLDTFWWKSKEGKETIVRYSDQIVDSSDVSWLDIQNLNPKILFYHLLTSEVGRHDYTDYLAGMYIFSGLGLAAIAGTQHSGAVGTPILYKNLASGTTIGEAWKDGLSYIVEHSGDKLNIYWNNHRDIWFEGTSINKAVLIGDGTLKLPSRK
jgi:hypothetical protein